jgi:ditrans,polycis-polyprenyl diphosphate synthase
VETKKFGKLGMSWFPERRTQDSWVHKICTSVLKAGPIPQHIAIIMDGNRRFAKKNSMAKAEGHLKGFDKLAEVCCNMFYNCAND